MIECDCYPMTMPGGILVHERRCATRPECDQCEALMINGVYCHETGCPNATKRPTNDDDE